MQQCHSAGAHNSLQGASSTLGGYENVKGKFRLDVEVNRERMFIQQAIRCGIFTLIINRC